MDTPGFYYGSHAGCAIYAPHRHPLITPDGKMTDQPHEYVVTVKAEVTIALSVDLDGTIRLRDGDFDVKDITSAEIDDRRTGRRAELEDDLWDRLIDALPRDGEIAIDGSSVWRVERKAPILDPEPEPVR